MIRLGINIDHVATLRQVHGGRNPDPVHAALDALEGGADTIIVHLRGDRRHIQDKDVHLLREVVPVPLFLEAAFQTGAVDLAILHRPSCLCLVSAEDGVPGISVDRHVAKIKESVQKLRDAGIEVSLLVDPDPRQINYVAESGAGRVEIHCGRFALADGKERVKELERIRQAVNHAHDGGLAVMLGHGIDYRNVRDLAILPGVTDLHVGHAVIARALIAGMTKAVAEMKMTLHSVEGMR